MKYLPIGTRVVYSHLAASLVRSRWYEDHIDEGGGGRWVTDSLGQVDRRDKNRASFRHGWRHDGRFPLLPPTRLRGGFSPSIPKNEHQLTRWVTVWPWFGEGYVTGLTFRSEGDRQSHWNGEFSETYLHETDRFPLYEVRRSLRAQSLLAPVWAVLPYGEWADLIDDPFFRVEEFNAKTRLAMRGIR